MAATRPRPVLDALDRQLVHVMQLAPRVSWADAGRVLGLSATTVAGRWRRLTDEGVAWIAVHPNPASPDYVTVIVDLSCEAASRTQLIATLSERAPIISIDESSRGTDLLLTVVVPDMAALSTLLLDELPTLPGVTGVRPSVVVKAASLGGDWRIGALSEAQLAMMQRHNPPVGARRGPAEWPDDVPNLVGALVRDGRISLADLARITGGHPTTIRRRLAALLADERIAFRCDVVHADFGVGVTSTYFAQVAPADIDRTVATLRRLGGLRVCLQVTGEHSLIFSMLSPSVAAVSTIQAAFGKHLPWLRINESRVLLRTPKRTGWLLNQDGRPTGRIVVPPMLGADQASLAASR